MGRTLRRAAVGRIVRRDETPLILLWLACASTLAVFTSRVRDWFVMTDELLYERLGISVAQLHSPLPRVHDELIPNVNQLYPVILGFVFGHGDVPASLRVAHIVNAFVMTSAMIPAFLLARRVTGSRKASYFVALLTVVGPWIVLSSFLLTEVVGYPAFLWALLALHVTTSTPSRRGDLLLVAGLVMAVTARTQFFVLWVIAPIVLVARAYGAARIQGGTGTCRLAIRNAIAQHRVIAAVYAGGAAAVVGLALTGRASAPLGTYAKTVSGNLLPSGIARSLLDHLGVLALSLGILPFIIGLAWLLRAWRDAAHPARHSFSLIAIASIVIVTAEVTIFDVRFGGGTARDRYLFYLVPLVAIAFTVALHDRNWVKAPFLIATAVVATGFGVARLPVFGDFHVDTPSARVVDYLVSEFHSRGQVRAFLVLVTLLSAVLLLQATALLPPRALVAGLALVTVTVFSAQAYLPFRDLFHGNGVSGRPVDQTDGSRFAWVDRQAKDGKVTMVPYPWIDGDYWASVAYWWDLEFWNESVDRAAYISDEFIGTPSTFPGVTLSFDPLTGVANIAPTRYVAELETDTRFHLYGNVAGFDRGLYIIDTGNEAWHAQWITMGLYDDGWTRPHEPGIVRVFPIPGQAMPQIRTLTVAIRAPENVENRRVVIVSNAGRWSGTVSASRGTTVVEVPVCEPLHGHTDVEIHVSGLSVGHGDMRNFDTFGAEFREVGVLLSEIALNGLGPRCSP